MRITIHEPQKFHLHLILPTRFVLNRLSARILSKAIHSTGKLEEQVLTEADLERLFQEVRRIKRKYRGMELVDVRAADGTIIKVRL